MELLEISLGFEGYGLNIGAMTVFVKLKESEVKDKTTEAHIIHKMIDEFQDYRNIHFRGDINTADIDEIVSIVSGLLKTPLHLHRITIEVTNQFRLESLKRRLTGMQGSLQRAGTVVSVIINVDLTEQSEDHHIIIQDLGWIRWTDAIRFNCENAGHLDTAMGIPRTIQAQGIFTNILISSSTGDTKWLSSVLLRLDFNWVGSSFDIRISN